MSRRQREAYDDHDSDTQSDLKEDKRHLKKGRYSAIKPTPSEKYNGKADSHKYFKFILQSVAYCKKVGISKEDQIQEISYYLTRKAYKFYLNEVSIEEYK